MVYQEISLRLSILHCMIYGELVYDKRFSCCTYMYGYGSDGIKLFGGGDKSCGASVFHEVFGEDLTRPNFFFVELLQCLEFVNLMSKVTIVLTDLGGIQKEVPSLGKPVLVMRDTIERLEALASGTVHLVGIDYDKIMLEVCILLDDGVAYEKMYHAVNPYGTDKFIVALQMCLLKRFFKDGKICKSKFRI